MRSEPARCCPELVKRIADGATATAIGTPDDVAAFKSARAK